ncbi:MAG: alpha/beta hydrolase [Candidatus Rokubacteria bacterium]|nr:alpha/beta hydrolase [Candidatus Rokubacteria bacterium]
MRLVHVNGVTLAVQEWAGGSPAVVCIHGLTANHTCWYPIASFVAPARRVIAHDLRGRGGSARPDTGYSLAAHDADLLGLLDHLGIARAVVIGHSLGAGLAVRFAVHHPERVERVILFDGGFDPRAEVFDSIGPAVGRLGVEFPSLDAFLGTMRGLPMFAGRWNEHLERYFTYDVEPAPGGGVRSKVARHAIEEEVRNLQRTRLWVWHHRVQAPTLLLRAPDGLLRADDCLMTQEEAEAMAAAIPDCGLVVVPGTNHYTVLLGDQPLVRRAVGEFLGL